jgi:DNA-binding transcriptional MerR regulator
MVLNEKNKFQLSEDELNFLTNQEYLEEFPNLLNTLNEPKFTIGHLNVTPRDATYWDKQGVLPDIKGIGMRRKYDLVQSVWIKLIQQMRTLGISLKSIKKLKESLLKGEIDIDEWKKEDIERVVKEMSVRLGVNFESEQLLKSISNGPPSFFTSIILYTIIYRKPMYCVVNKEGNCYIYSPRGQHVLAEMHDGFHEFMSQPYYCLSITEAYCRLVQEWAPKPFISELSILSNTELEILEYIRKKDVLSIKIRYKKGEPDLIEIESQNEISMEQRFLDVIARKGYQKISAYAQNGKIVNFENKIQKKLNSRTK